MSIVAVNEDEPDEGNGPIVTIRDNMIAIVVIVVLAVGNLFVTAHYHPWQLSSVRPAAQPTNARTTIGCCAAISDPLRPTTLTPCRCIDTRAYSLPLH